MEGGLGRERRDVEKKYHIKRSEFSPSDFEFETQA